MTTDLILFPDAADLVIAHLGDVLGVPVRSQVPNPRPDAFVTIRRIGGTRQTLVTDGATLAVECWAQLPQDAMDLAQLTRAHLHALPRTLEGIPVYRVEEFAGPADLPDPVSNQARAVLTVLVHVRGVTAVGS